MAEIVILLAIEKIGIALANGAATQASALFVKYGTQLLELQRSMDRVVRELRLMHDFLCQMDIRNRNKQAHESWLVEVRKVAHMMEDMVDEYLYLVGRERDMGCCFYLKKGLKKPRYLLSLNHIAFKVKEIEKDLLHLSETKNRWVHVNDGDTDSSNYIVKRSQELADTSRSIDDEDLDVLRNITKELFKDSSVLCSMVDMNIMSLKEMLKNFLEQRKYLIILDDVWTTEVFDDLSSALIQNAKGSRLIITTREARVAAVASQGCILTLEPLSVDNTWSLFCKKAFPRDTNHACPAELKPLSEEIANKCKGLPLVIVLVGSLLRVREKTVEEWREISVQLSWELINNAKLDQIRNVLHLSFIYLPTQLKRCFLYCSLFPEDYIFRRKQLIRLWIVEGFIEEKGQSTLEEVAESYLRELVNRNMLQLVQRNMLGRMRRFRMHDILHDLAADLCKNSSFGVIYENKCGGSHHKDGRRLVLHKQTKNDIQQPFSTMHQLRTFITLGDSKSPFNLLPLLCKESRYLTVLELSGLPVEKIPDAIGDLFNLRHLGLRDSKVKMLPKSLEKLSHLLTLDLCRSDIHELPSGIVKLKKLRHLFAERIIDPTWREFKCRGGVCIPNGLGNLTNLQTLQALEAQDESLRHLGELRQMRSLRLWNVKGIYCGLISESLVQMQYLSYLDVNTSDDNEVLLLNVCLPSLQKLTLRGRLAEPLFQDVGGQNLYRLSLYWSQLREDPLSSLSRLSNLTCLCFIRAYNGEQLAFLTGWFPKLKILSLRDLPNLSRLEIQEGAIASLERLVLTNLRSMTEVPAGIELLLPLEYLCFWEISSDFLMLLHQCSAIQGTQWQHTLRR